MNITDSVEGYSDIEAWDKRENDMQRSLLSDEAQTMAVEEAKELGIWGGYSELWEDGFRVEDEEGERLSEIENEMDEIYCERFAELIANFLEENEEEAIEV